MLSQLLTQDCVITRALASASIDDYGNEIPDEEIVTTKCALQQTSRAEAGAYGETSESRWLLVLPAGTAITTADSIEVDGRIYQLDGDPTEIWNPRVRAHSHVEATVMRTAGAEDAS